MSGVTNQQSAEEDKKPGGDQSAHINLKVKGQVYIYIYTWPLTLRLI